MAHVPEGESYNPKRHLRVRYTADAMIDLMIASPEISQNELASQFGFTPSHISLLVNADAFQHRLAERKEALVDPILRATIEDRMKAATSACLDLILEKVAAKAVTVDEATKVVAITAKALGYGAKVPVQTVNNYVAFLPTRSTNSADWSANHGRHDAATSAPLTIENAD